MADPQFDPSKPFDVAPAGLLTPGNIDLTKRPRVQNPDGSISTVRSMSFEQDGKEILIPTVIGGKVVSDDAAMAYYKKTGQHLGIFDSPAAATTFAQQLHDGEAAKLTSSGFDPSQSFTTPAAGTWEDRGVAGKMWHPAGAPVGVERPREDASGAIGVDHAAVSQRIADWASTLQPSLQKPAAILATLPADAIASLVEMFSAPESIAAAGARPAMAAMDAVGAGAAATGRALRSVATSPVVRNTAAAIVKHGATAAGAYGGGVPGAIVGSQVGDAAAGYIRAPVRPPAPPPEIVSAPGYPRGGPTAAPSPAAAPAAAVDEFTAARTARQTPSNGYPDQRALNDEAIAAARARYQASQAGAPAAADKIIAASGKMKLTADEFKEFTRLVRQPGMTFAKAEQAVKAARELAAKLGGASDAEVAKAVAHMQATGKW